MALEPGQITNADLAQRISTLVDRWNTRENQLIDLLSLPDADVTVTDGLGVNHTLPSFPKLQKQVAVMTDTLTGAVAEARDINSQSTALLTSVSGYADDAQASAEASAGSATDSAASASSSKASADASAGSAAASASSASSADASAQEAASSASAASASKDSAAASAVEASSSAQESAASAAQSQGHASNAADSAAEAQSWALTAQTTVTGLLHYMGSWDASSGTFPPNPVKGDFWKVGRAGVVGGTDLAIGDQIIYGGSGWDKIDNTESVTAVAGKVGSVTLLLEDVAGLKDALGSKVDTTGFTWSALAGKPTTFPPSAHSHAISEVSGLSAALDGKAPVMVGGDWLSSSNSLTANTIYDTNDPSYWTAPGSYMTISSLPAATNRQGIALAASYGPNQLFFMRSRYDQGGDAPWNRWKPWVELYHSGNFNPANYVQKDTWPGLSGLTITGTGNLYRRTANGAADVYQPRVFVQGSDPGAGAYDGDLWVW